MFRTTASAQKFGMVQAQNLSVLPGVWPMIGAAEVRRFPAVAPQQSTHLSFAEINRKYFPICVAGRASLSVLRATRQKVEAQIG
jgi:hypothetical protein